MRYKYIWAWGKLMGSYDTFIQREINMAEEDGAPEDAVYRRSDGTWATFEQIHSEATKQEIREILEAKFGGSGHDE